MTDPSKRQHPTGPTIRCPICSEPAVQKYRPFCSKRCADVDLNRWLSGRYVVATHDDADEDGERPAEDEPAVGQGKDIV